MILTQKNQNKPPPNKKSCCNFMQNKETRIMLRITIKLTKPPFGLALGSFGLQTPQKHVFQNNATQFS